MSGPTQTQLDTIAYTAGIDADGVLTAVDGWRWAGDDPATYNGPESTHKWGGGIAGTPGGTVSYYFDVGSNWSADEMGSFTASLTLWSDLANIQFVQTADAAAANMTFYRYGSTTPGADLDDGAYAEAQYVAGRPGDVTIPTTQKGMISIDTVGAWSKLDSFTDYGGYGPGTIVHELGHLMGLMHTGPYNGDVNIATQQYNATDTTLWSIMSYIGPGDSAAKYFADYPVQGTDWGRGDDGYTRTPVTPMMLDIAAVQQLYGQSTSATFSGGQIYGFNCNISDAARPFFDFTVNTAPVITLWNYGTGNTLDLSGYATGSTINLNPGTFSSCDGMINNIGIAYNTVIDHAIGGAGDDMFYVSNFSSWIDGQGGNNVVMFGGYYVDYSISRAEDTVTVIDNILGHGGTYTLLNIQLLQFTDRSVHTSEIPCFAKGTRILTQRGAVAVEDLAVGDLLVTLRRARLAPVRWIGHRTVDCRHHPRPWDVMPVRVSASAFGPQQPHRDVVLSPDHAVFVDGVLIPIRYLINGTTIVQQSVSDVTYYHVELPVHDVIVAEGLPAESYLDTGNRSTFANGGTTAMLHADFARDAWTAQGCAELVLAGPQRARVRQRLLTQAAALGHALTDDPELSVCVDGHDLPAEVTGSTWRVRLPAGASRLRLASRVGVPAHVCAEQDDTRPLGVAISDLRIDGQAVPPGDPRRGRGWHAPEEAWQWTDGDAELACTGAREVTFAVAFAGRYWQVSATGSSRNARRA
ncbi:Hint domain-containing protein [Limobrevibacterium gyesilva]|uniref:Hint domain-containing protein n=1 Tax=Limobrevibacterium gyesilva TaxID=2991712 RepID=A0AA41YPB9_9PROT|nr:Hint domain-containing protein [Limobrevibacterium gyesilva]MCW3476430.1 Hint domain-containing protein [Limobrevibacterium gyesilva]